jgi:hypothetical protein
MEHSIQRTGMGTSGVVQVGKGVFLGTLEDTCMFRMRRWRSELLRVQCTQTKYGSVTTASIKFTDALIYPYRGTAWAIAYESDLSKIQMEDLVVFSVSKQYVTLPLLFLYPKTPYCPTQGSPEVSF